MNTSQTPKLKIGLLLNNHKVPAWFYSSLERIARSEHAEFPLVIINEKGDPYDSKMNRLRQNYHKSLYFIYRKLDETVFKSKPDAFERKDIRDLLGAATYLTVTPIQKRYSDYISSDDIETIKSFELDILVRGGFRILRGEILTASRYGTWSYHHGDNIVNRGGPAGFWEVAEGWPETGSILQVLSESLDGGKVLYRSWVSTYQFSVAKNRNQHYWTSASFLPRQVERLYNLGEEQFFTDIEKYNTGLNCYDGRLYKAPTNLETVSICFRLLRRIIKRIAQQILYRKQWILMVDRGNETGTSFRKFKKVLPPKDRLWADPFVVFHDNRYTVFVEEYLYHKGKGHISAIEVDEKGSWGSAQPVLEESYHLSYPFIVKWKDHYYMVPETSSAKTIQVYECKNFPNKWEYRMTLIDNIIAVDPTLFYWDGLWWLFAGVMENRGASKSVELSLFYSKELLSKNWTPHPMNPIVSDIKNARPAGKIMEANGKLYRVAQDCSKRYGSGFNINEIVSLTEDSYQERKVERISPRWDHRILGMHTFNRDRKLTVIDALVRRSRFSASLLRAAGA